MHRAIKRFYIKHEGTRVGGSQREAKAMWINEKEFIHELPYCYLMHRNKRKFICGKPSKKDDDEQGEYGMCVLEGCEAPEKCIISSFRSLV